MRKIVAASVATVLLVANLVGLVGAHHLTIGQEAIVTDALYLRAEPGANNKTLDLMPAGSIVFVRAGPEWVNDTGWYIVEQDGKVGWADGEYVQPRDSAAALQAISTDDRTISGTSARGTTRAAAKLATGTEGVVTDNVRLRAKPGTTSDALDLLPNGSIVYVVDGPEAAEGDSWYKIEQDGKFGWADGDYIVPRTTPAGAEAQSKAGRATTSGTTDGGSSQPAPAPKLTTGKEAIVTDNVRLRAEPGTDQKSIDVLPYGSVVYVIDGPKTVGGAGWYKVEQDGHVGWASGDYIDPRGSTAALKARPSAARSPAGGSSSASSAASVSSTSSRGSSSGSTSSASSSTGSGGGAGGGSIAGTALVYVGAPYVYGGTTPRGWDCSGFTSYVLAQYGIYPGRTTYAQWANGRAVSSSELAPGDLVFFANTFGPGISHVGIYIGGGRMVNASSERTGTRVDSIGDAYWGSHYAGARRYN